MQQAHRIVIVNANVAIKLLPFHLRSFHSLLLTNQSNRHHNVVIVSTDATIKSLSPRIVDATNNSDDQEESIGCGTENRIDEVEKCWIIGLMISVWIEWSTATVLWLLVYYLVKWEIMLGALVFIHRYYFQLLMMYEFLHAFDKSNAWGIRWSLHADLPSRKNRLLGFPPPKFSKKATTDGRRKVFFVSRNFWLTKVFFQILAGKAVSGRCFNPLRPPKYIPLISSSHHGCHLRSITTSSIHVRYLQYLYLG